MKQVHRRLDVTDVGHINQGIEQDIIDSLKEMIAALDKKKDEMDKNKKNPPPKPPKDGDSGPPPDQKLLDQIAELKMIRSMQVRLNGRTERYCQAISRDRNSQRSRDPNVRREVERVARSTGTYFRHHQQDPEGGQQVKQFIRYSCLGLALLLGGSQTVRAQQGFGTLETASAGQPSRPRPLPGSRRPARPTPPPCSASRPSGARRTAPDRSPGRNVRPGQCRGRQAAGRRPQPAETPGHEGARDPGEGRPIGLLPRQPGPGLCPLAVQSPGL